MYLEFLTDEEKGLPSINPEARRYRVSYAFDEMEKFEQKSGLSIVDGLTRKQYIEMFNSMMIRHSTTFTAIKTEVRVYLRYLIERGVLDSSHDDIVNSIQFEDMSVDHPHHVRYFKDLLDLQHYIQLSLEEDKSIEPKKKFEIHIAILYLAWYGFSWEEVINVKKTDVVDGGVMRSGELIEMAPDVVSFLEKVKASEGYMQKARGDILRKYVPSEYLIRTERSEKLERNTLFAMIKRLNAVCDKRYSLLFETAHWSGVFYRAAQIEREYGENEFMRRVRDDWKFSSEVFDAEITSAQKLYNVLKDYKFYKQFFES